MAGSTTRARHRRHSYSPAEAGLESGLTREQIAEALTHLGFYAGWPNATKSLMAITRTLGK
jgi:alkylhydroperoxidase/carboxymuconolactone decarboxylase family protein YurZ